MLALALFIAVVGPPPAVTSVPTPVGLEAKLVLDAKDGELGSMDLLDAALIASGVADADVAAEAKRVRQALAPAVAAAKTQRTAHRRGEVLLRGLHETVFRKYVATATEIDDVIRTGEYNCLSSALLYVVAAQGLLDQPKGMVTVHHAFARVTADGKVVDVETTTPQGFDADRVKLMTPEHVRKIAGPGTSPAELLADLMHPEELPVLSLIAAVYSNRAVGLTQRGDLQGAATALDRAARLASGSLKTRAAAWRGSVLNNGAIELVNQGRLDDAAALLQLALLEGTAGQTQKLLTENLAAVHEKIAERALAAKDWTGAVLHMEDAERLGLHDTAGRQIKARANAELAALEGSDARCKADKATVGTAAGRAAAECLAGLARALRDKDLDLALQQARRAYALGPDVPNAERALLYMLVTKAKAETDARRCDAVDALVHEATPHTAVLDGQKWDPAEVMGTCWARVGDAAFDKKDWAAASEGYGRARGYLPHDDGLQKNLGAVDVNRAIEVAKLGACDDARPLARRAARLDPSLTDKSTQLLESCAAVRAKKAADAADWPVAVAELRRGLQDAPTSAVLRQNLGTMLHNLAGALLRAKDCDAARALLPELEALHKSEAREAIRKACP